jgi:DMSO/TMAO reductase YedYZ heme-binding membrane subunit
MLDVHRFAALLALSAIAVHGVGLVYDTSVPIDVPGLLIPGRIAYRPFWTGTGVVAAELMLAITFSFSVRKYIGARNWRRLHWLTYALFVAATAHGLFAGTDSRRPWVQMVYLSAIGAVSLAVTWRALTAGRPKRRPLPHRTAPAEPSTAR